MKTNYWKDIPDLPGYRASFDGEIMGPKGRILRQNKICPTNGQPQVYVWKGKEKKQYYKKHLIAAAFLGPLPNGYACVTKNGIKTDCSVPNLQYLPRREACSLSRGGIRKNVAKLNHDGEIVEFYKSIKEAAMRNYMNNRTVSYHCNDKAQRIYAPDGYAYCFDDEKAIRKKQKQIQEDRNEKVAE